MKPSLMRLLAARRTDIGSLRFYLGRGGDVSLANEPHVRLCAAAA